MEPHCDGAAATAATAARKETLVHFSEAQWLRDSVALLQKGLSICPCVSAPAGPVSSHSPETCSSG